MSDALRPNAAAVATSHPLGADAARRMLDAGGNAVDAAVAAMAAMCVAVPGAVGFGGYGGSLVLWPAKTGKCHAIDFDSRAPLAYRDALFADDWTAKSTHGYLAVTVPAVVAGLATALKDFGTKTWKQATARATELADEGVPVTEALRKGLVDLHAKTDDLSRAAQFPDGRVPAVGQPWVQKDLAAMLRRLADEGPEAFYRGEIPEKIARQVHNYGGILTEADFASYKPRVVEPLRVGYRGHELFTPPPPSGGITALQILKTLEPFDLATLEPWGADYLHLFLEATKLCWAERERVLGDPDFVKMPLEQLLSDESAGERAAKIRRDTVRDTKPAATRSDPHTANVCIVDADGNLVSLTATQGAAYGSRVVIDGLGLVMNHGMSRFDWVANHPNRPAPGKRMHHNMSPAIALRDGRPIAAVGLPGGTRIVTVTAQLLVNLIDFQCTADRTVHAPRVHVEATEPVAASASVGPAVVAKLKAMGHKFDAGQTGGESTSSVGGPANAVVIDVKGQTTAASGAGEDAAAVVSPSQSRQ